MDNSFIKTINNLPLNDRPYEKLELVGPTNLTNSELLAIIIQTGTKKSSCLDIARSILNDSKNINMSDIEFLSKLSLEELKAYSGVGRVKAIKIKAVVELAKRIAKTHESNLQKDKITTPRDVFDLVGQLFCFEKQECLRTILLNKSYKCNWKQ